MLNNIENIQPSGEKKTKISNIRNKTDDITKDSSYSQKIIRNYCEQFYANKFDNLDDSKGTNFSRLLKKSLIN